MYRAATVKFCGCCTMEGPLVSVQGGTSRKQGETAGIRWARMRCGVGGIPPGTVPAIELLGTSVPPGNRIHGSQLLGLFPCSEGVGGTAYCNPGCV